MSWSEGAPSGSKPVNVPNGGPGGAGDRYLENFSSGGSGAGSRQAMYNTVQWTGNYVAARASRITADLANLGSTPLYMRFAVRGGPNFTSYVSTQPFVVPADGNWRTAAFDLSAASLTNVSGPDSLATVLGEVLEVRLVSSQNFVSYIGDAVNSRLGVDNIRAVDAAAADLRTPQIGFVNDAPRISFATASGRTYRVEYKNALTDANWSTLSGAGSISGNGGVVSIDDTQAGAADLPTRFYRVVLLAP